MAGSSFSLKIDSTQLDAGVDANVQRQLPYAISVALSRTAQAVMAGEVKQMHDVFDRATPYTLAALRVKFATKARLVAEVSYKDESFKGTPATKYLAPEVDGGTRSVKRIESLLRARGLLPSDMYVVPGAAAKLDQYGNFSRGQYSQILAQLQASRDYAQNETKTSRARKRRNPTRDVRYFVGRPGGGKFPLGVWARYQFAQGYSVRPVLMFVSMPHYSKLFPFYETAESMTASTLPTELAAALAMAMRTSR
jgi:hypothetical protein